MNTSTAAKCSQPAAHTVYPPGIVMQRAADDWPD
jgi:hypothetical protein